MRSWMSHFCFARGILEQHRRGDLSRHHAKRRPARPVGPGSRRSRPPPAGLSPSPPQRLYQPRAGPAGAAPVASSGHTVHTRAREREHLEPVARSGRDFPLARAAAAPAAAAAVTVVSRNLAASGHCSATRMVR